MPSCQGATTLLALLLIGLSAIFASAKPLEGGEEQVTERTYFLLFTETCWDTFFHDFDFFNFPCLKSLLAKGVGLGIVFFSFLLKAPQIFNIVKARSARGLELSSLYLDVVAFICPAIYSFRQGHPFLSYGESVVILVQNIVIVLLAWAFAEKSVSVVAKLGAVVAFGVAVVAGFALPPQYLPILPSVAIVMTISSRVPQIWANFQAKDTGVLSSITWLLNFVGAVVRVLTTLSETGDVMQMLSFALGASCSGVILVQICIYGKKSTQGSKDVAANKATVQNTTKQKKND